MAKLVHLTNSNSDARNLISELLNDVDDYEILIFVGVKKNDDIMVGHTGGSSIEKAGLMAFASDNFLGRCYE